MRQKGSSTITGPSSSECSSKTPPFKTIKALFAAMPSGMGVPAEAVDTAEEMAAAITRALAEPGPNLIQMNL